MEGGKKLFTADVEAKVELAKDLVETRDILGMSTREYDALRAKVDELEEGLVAVCDALMVNEEKNTGV